MFMETHLGRQLPGKILSDFLPGCLDQFNPAAVVFADPSLPEPHECHQLALGVDRKPLDAGKQSLPFHIGRKGNSRGKTLRWFRGTLRSRDLGKSNHMFQLGDGEGDLIHGQETFPDSFQCIPYPTGCTFQYPATPQLLPCLGQELASLLERGFHDPSQWMASMASSRASFT